MLQRLATHVLRKARNTQQVLPAAFCGSIRTSALPVEGQVPGSSSLTGGAASFCFQLGTPPCRGFATGSQPPPQDGSIKEATSILQRLDTAHFREVLEHESQRRWNMEHSELVRLCIDCGAASSVKDAESICEALDKSGIILRVKQLCYLRPLEVAEIIYRALPDTDREVRARLEQLKAEMQPLQQQKQAIDNHAHSTDVMEPVTYFTAAAFGIATYAYCLYYNEEFGFHRARERIHSSLQDKNYAQKGFDKARYDYLLRRVHRLESSLSFKAPLKHRARHIETEVVKKPVTQPGTA